MTSLTESQGYTFITDNRLKTYKSVSSECFQHPKFQKVPTNRVQVDDQVPILNQIGSLHQKNIEKVLKHKSQHQENQQRYELKHSRYQEQLREKNEYIHHMLQQQKKKLKKLDRKKLENSKKHQEAFKLHQDRQESQKIRIREKEMERETQAVRIKMQYQQTLENSRQQFSSKFTASPIKKENSYSLFISTMNRLQNAENKRQYLQKKKIKEIDVESRLQKAKDRNQQSYEHRQSHLLSQSVCKLKKHEMMANQQNLSSRSRVLSQSKKERKRHEQTILKKDYIKKSDSMHMKESYAKNQQKSILSSLKKQQFLKSYTNKLNQSRASKQAVIAANNATIYHQYKLKGDQTINRQKKSWQYITTVKQQKDQLITENIYHSQQVSLRM